MINPPACQAYSASVPNAYGYKPSLAAGIIFVACFFLSACTHIFQAIRYKRWWLYLFALGAGVETMGWIGRLGSSQCAYSKSFFVLQISLLIIAPAFTTAGLYVILFSIIPILGRHTSPFPPKTCLYICLGVDIISIVAQGVGGGMAGGAFSMDRDTKPGTYTMVGGILFQLVSLIVYSVLVIIVFSRGWGQLVANKPLRTLGTVMVVSICCMITRGIFRSVELLEGWTGYLNTHQAYLLVLDATLMVIGVGIFNFFNPGKLLEEAGRGSAGQSVAMGQSSSDEEVKGPNSA